MNHPEHICRFNDAPQTCECYDAGFDQARAEERERVVGLATKDRNKYARKVAIVGVPHLYDYYKGKISSLDDLIEAVKE